MPNTLRKRRLRPIRRRLGTALVSVGLVAGLACGQPELVGRDGGQGSDDAHFAENATGVRFAALGDFGTGEADQLAVAEQMCLRRADYPFNHVVTTGDNVYASGEIQDFDEDFYIPYACLFEEGVDFHAVLGNHDLKTLEGEGQIAEPRFGMLGRYYTWGLGPVTFVMFDSQAIDAELDADTELDADSQYQWVMNEIEQAQDSEWTVAVFHDPVYSTGERHGSKPGWDEAIAEPFSEAGVDLVLNGHDHNFQWGEEDGVTYVVTGGGGAALYPCQEPFVEPMENCLEEHHFVEVVVSGDSMTVKAISKEGELLDTVSVTPNE